jgi:hypothetical protein
MSVTDYRFASHVATPDEVRDAELEVRPGKWLRRTGLLETLAVLWLALLGPIPNARGDDRKLPTREDCAEKAERFAAGRLQVWQQRLKLDEWKFSLVFSRPADLRPNTVGNIRWDNSAKSAVIRILDAADYQSECHEALIDMEFTIVHELLHLKFSLLPRCDAIRMDEESAVNDIARVLLALDRPSTDRVR